MLQKLYTGISRLLILAAPTHSLTWGHAMPVANGVGADAAQAVLWFRLAANLSHAGAQFRLGQCYSTGAGVAIDHVQAAAWFRRAADSEHAEALLSLGGAYERGIDIEADAEQAAVGPTG